MAVVAAGSIGSAATKPLTAGYVPDALTNVNVSPLEQGANRFGARDNVRRTLRHDFGSEVDWERGVE